MAVRICLEIGHEASLRTKKTQEGFTHDWEVFVRGCDGAEIHYYIEKVVFYLHETFPKPKRVVKEPPYSVKESGYAGFNLPIDIYLRNNNEPKKIRFNYDLHLQPSGPPILKVQKEKYVFNSVSDEFKIKLMKGGATIGGSSSFQDVTDNRSTIDEKNQMTNKPKLSGCEFKKQKIKIGEPCRDFQELFGSPINMSKSSEPKSTVSKSDNKDKSRTKHSPHKDSHKDKEKSKEKTDSEKKSRDEKKQKERSKDRERSKDKSIKKEKSPRPKSPSPKRSPKRFSSPPVVKKDSNKHDKEKREKFEERKPKKEKRSKEHKENKHGEEQKTEEHKDKNRSETKKDSNKVKTENSLSSPKLKEKPKEKSSKESSKEDKYSEKYKHKKKDKEKREKKEEKSYKSEKKSEKPPIEPKPNLFKSEQVKKEKTYVSPVVPTIDDDSSNSSTTSSNSSLIDRPQDKKLKTKEEKNPKLKKEKGYQDNTIKCKRKSESVEKDEPPEKLHKDHVNNNSDMEQDVVKPVLPQPAEEVCKYSSFFSYFCVLQDENYFGLLRDLQHKIMGLKDNSELQKVVKLIAETGRYEVSAHTFDFDLCLLDRSTVQQLQDFFASET